MLSLFRAVTASARAATDSPITCWWAAQAVGGAPGLRPKLARFAHPATWQCEVSDAAAGERSINSATIVDQLLERMGRKCSPRAEHVRIVGGVTGQQDGRVGYRLGRSRTAIESVGTHTRERPSEALHLRGTRPPKFPKRRKACRPFRRAHGIEAGAGRDAIPCVLVFSFAG